MRVPWTAKRSNQSILKVINPKYSLEELILKLKLQYLDPLMQRAVHGIFQAIVLEWIVISMARENVDILGISELKWTGMGEFNSDDHYIHYCGDRKSVV